MDGIDTTLLDNINRILIESFGQVDGSPTEEDTLNLLEYTSVCLQEGKSRYQQASHITFAKGRGVFRLHCYCLKVGQQRPDQVNELFIVFWDVVFVPMSPQVLARVVNILIGCAFEEIECCWSWLQRSVVVRGFCIDVDGFICGVKQYFFSPFFMATSP
ncbi:unnamed protein product [Rhizopus stolonifer]